MASIWLDGPLDLGLDPTHIVLLSLTAIVSVLTVVPGRATRLQGGVHLVVLAAYLLPLNRDPPRGTSQCRDASGAGTYTDCGRKRTYATLHRIAGRGAHRAGGSVRSDASLRDVLPYFVFAFACFCAAPYLGLSSRDVDPRIAEVWPPGGVGFVLLTVIWFTGRRVVVGTLTAMVLIYAVTAMAMGYHPAWALWLALCGAAQPWVMAAIYRSQLASPELGSGESAGPGGPVLRGRRLLAGPRADRGYPTLSAGEPSKVLLWWVLRNSVFCFVGGVTFMVMFYGCCSRRICWSAGEPDRASGHQCPCVYGTYYNPSLPLSWLLIIPSVWGWLTLTVRGTAYSALDGGPTASMTYLPQNQFGYTGLLPAASIVDLLVIASTAFALLALMREQRGQLIHELDRKGAESESQRQLLETVFDSMNDGVVLLDDSSVTMYNNAARQLLGRPIPAWLDPDSWVEAFDLRTPEGAVLDEDALREKLIILDGAADAAGIEVLVGHDGATRIVAINSAHVGTSADSFSDAPAPGRDSPASPAA